MDPLDNPRIVKATNESCEAEESGKRPADSESPIEDARREKIESLKKAVAEGTYSVRAEEVARKLIDHMLEPKE